MAVNILKDKLTYAKALNLLAVGIGDYVQYNREDYLGSPRLMIIDGAVYRRDDDGFTANTWECSCGCKTENVWAIVTK